MFFWCENETSETGLSVAKLTPSRNSASVRMLKNEKELLEHFSGHPMLPRFQKYESGVPASLLSYASNVVRFGKIFRDELEILVRTYIPGKHFLKSDLITDLGQQRDMIDLLDESHELGYSGIDVGPVNWLWGNSNSLHLLDFGARYKLGHCDEKDFFNFATRDYLLLGFHLG